MSFNEDIKAYIDGELSPERALEVKNAIESDPALMEEYTSMKVISQKLQSLIRQPQVKGVEQTRRAVAPVRRFRLIEGIAVAAVLVIVAAVIFPVFSQAKESSKAAAALSLAKQERLRQEMEAEDAKSKGYVGYTNVPELSEGGDRYMQGGAGRAADDLFGASMGVGSAAGEQQPAHKSTFGSESPNKPRVADKTTAAARPESVSTIDADMEARLVIKDASFTVKVADVNDAMSKATHLASTYKGYIESSSISQGAEKVPTSGLISIRLPQANFEKAIEEISKYGTVTDRNTSGDDVTGNVADIEARIRTLTSEEESLRTILRSANKIGDVLEIKDRISQVRQQIESYDSQRRVLTRLSTLATISLRFTTDKEDVKKLDPKDKDDAWFEDTKDAALTILTGIGKFIAQIATFAFVLLPVWVPVLLFLLWFRRRAFVPTA